MNTDDCPAWTYLFEHRQSSASSCSVPPYVTTTHPICCHTNAPHTGRGRGLVVTSDIPAGTLLLLCHPLTVLTGTPGTALTPSELVTHFEQGLAQSHSQRQNTPQQQHQEGDNVSCEQQLQQTPGTWVSIEQSKILDSLFDGSHSSASAAPLPLQQLAAVCLSPSMTTPPATSEEQCCYKLADGRLQRIIEFNCKGEACPRTHTEVVGNGLTFLMFFSSSDLLAKREQR